MRAAYGELASRELALRKGHSEAPTELASRALERRRAVGDGLQRGTPTDEALLEAAQVLSLIHL